MTQAASSPVLTRWLKARFLYPLWRHTYAHVRITPSVYMSFVELSKCKNVQIRTSPHGHATHPRVCPHGGYHASRVVSRVVLSEWRVSSMCHGPCARIVHARCSVHKDEPGALCFTPHLVGITHMSPPHGKPVYALNHNLFTPPPSPQDPHKNVNPRAVTQPYSRYKV